MSQFASKTITRPDFEALSQFERATKIREGYKVVNPPQPAAKAPQPVGPKEIRRADFDALWQHERAAKIKAGFKVVD
jgi:hypothetical protein